jgi:hypothetical protein
MELSHYDSGNCLLAGVSICDLLETAESCQYDECEYLLEDLRGYESVWGETLLLHL